MGQWVDVIRALAALTAVASLLWVFFLMSKRTAGAGGGGVGPTIVARRGITNGVSVVTVKDSGERIVMVVSERHTEVISRSPWLDPDPADPGPVPAFAKLPGQLVFGAMLEKATGKKTSK